MLVYTKPTRIACEMFKGTLFRACAHVLYTVTVTEQKTCTTQQPSPDVVLPQQESTFHGSASEHRSIGQQEKPELNMRINTNIMTRLQNLGV